MSQHDFPMAVAVDTCFVNQSVIDNIKSLLEGPKMQHRTLATTLNEHFHGKIFRLKGFGPSVLYRFEVKQDQLNGNQHFGLIFKSIYNEGTYKTTVEIARGLPPEEYLVEVIKRSHEIVDDNDLSEMDYLLYKKEDSPFEGFGIDKRIKNVDFGKPLSKKDLNEAIEIVLNGTTMAKSSSYIPAGLQ